MDKVAIWSLILTGALVLVTGVYAWLTFLIAKRSKESADAALSAAQASERAAEASQKMAVLAEASLTLTFGAIPERHSDGSVWMRIYVRGANVWLHSARIQSGVVVERLAVPSRKLVATELHAIDAAHEFPLYIPEGPEGVSLDWRGSPYRDGDWGCGGSLMLEYSLTRESERITREQSFENPEDFYYAVNEKLGTLLDKKRPWTIPALGDGEPRGTGS